MDTLFEVLLLDKKASQSKMFFFEDDDITAIANEKILVFMEYIQLEMLFRGMKEYKLTIEGINEKLSDSAIEDAKGNIQYYASEDIIPLYNIDKNVTDPLIPGYYEVTVSNGEKTYFSWFKIIPKSLSIPEWEMMKVEIENTISGLSTELIKRKTSTYDQKKLSNYNMDMLNKLDFISKDISRLNSVMEQLLFNPRHKISKSYSWKEYGKKTPIDMETIKNMSRFPEKKGYLYSPTRFLDYDVSENRWLKHIIKYFAQFITDAQYYLKKYKLSLEYMYSNDKYKNISEKKRNVSLENIDRQMKALKRFDGLIQQILNIKWMKEISSVKMETVPAAMLLDLRYSYIHKLYLKILNKGSDLQLNSEYQYYWKRSDLLYEIWGYIKMVNLLINMGYEPIDGWLYSEGALTDLVIPFLQDGTCVVFKKSETIINLFYNDSLPKSNKNPTIKKPLFTKSSNNKPDIRLDVSRNNIYLGSLIFDTKYRSFENIWKNKDKTKNQLRNYRNAIESPILLKGSHYSEPAISRFRAVSEVWVLFPKSSNIKSENKIYEEEKINFKELSPSSELETFEKDLSIAISELESMVDESQ
ncbi:conserved hypothetical protein [Carnobacterium maltaromaticum LMA28]|uniref:DUF2357 domain-containing protein n=1 Tax=Carnobacterium maltaromaticum LMA28 TaxID=1234679 RepID=K8E1F0_CARML|nr:nuclease domain-containing protein [Carnobacterium maltaromaticum]CCO09584.2 conserved hypothetical protein [Carnobacterium maltaromaticum LMA28]